MKKLVLFSILFLSMASHCQKLPNGFVYLSEVDKTIQSELRYITKNNFVGKPIVGYHEPVIIVSNETAVALKKIQRILKQKNLSLKIFDAYRPQTSVNHFVKWAKVLDDTLMKQEYYPKVPKSELFQQGYIASKSGHTRGSTVDLTILDLATGLELDMGGTYDFFGEESHTYFDKITPLQKQNRLFLRQLMIENGFNPYNKEWWHFSLKNEPFPKTYFSFPIE